MSDEHPPGELAALPPGELAALPPGELTALPPGAMTAPAAARNREPILAVLREWLPGRARVLEVASGTGEHAVWFAAGLPGVIWQPTENTAERLASIAAWRGEAGGANLLAPVALDAGAAEEWPVVAADAVVAINMIHIAPWGVTLGLMTGAARVLRPGGVLLLYGPFREAGVDLAESNAAFDADLRERDASWGLRGLGEVTAVAAAVGLRMEARRLMPAHNLAVLFRRD